MAKRLLLFSNSTNFGEPYLQYPRPHIKAFLGTGVKKVLFVPYAGITMNHDDYTKSVAEAFAEIGYEVEGIHTHDNAEKAVREAEAIAVGGGNTFALLKAIYENGILEAVQERVAAGMPYMGWSAGSNVACPAIKTTNDMPVAEPPSFQAFNMVPFQINAHYSDAQLPNHGGETRAQRLNEFIEVNQQTPVVGLPEGTFLQVEDNTIRYVGGTPMCLFRYGKEVAEFTATDDLQFLL